MPNFFIYFGFHFREHEQQTTLAFLIVVNQCLLQFTNYYLIHKSCSAINHKKAPSTSFFCR